MILLLICVLPLSDLDSPHYAARQRARLQIVREGSLEEVDEALEKKNSPSVRKSLQWCRSRVIARDEERQLRALRLNLPTELLGWEQFKKILGNTKETRGLYIHVWRNYSSDIKEYFALKEKEKPAFLLSLDAKYDYWHRANSLSLKAFLLHLTPVEEVRDNVLGYQEYYSCDCDWCASQREPYHELTCELIEGLREESI